jgi:hypothetical protein
MASCDWTGGDRRRIRFIRQLCCTGGAAFRRGGRRDWGLHETVAASYIGTMSETDLNQLQALYREAFRDFGVAALWNMRPVQQPAPADALAITAALRTHGRMDGRRLAERIEQLCRADQ